MKNVKYLIIIALILLMAGCSKIGEQLSDMQAGTDSLSTGGVAISVVVVEKLEIGKLASAQLMDSLVKAGTVRLQKGNLVKIVDMVIANNKATATVQDLAAGTWTVQIDLLDANGNVLYTGTSTFDVVPGEVTNVTVSLTRQTGDVNIVIDLPQDPTANYSPSSISPDGTKCVTIRYNTLYITNLITGGAQYIYSSAERINCASWSIDGTRIVFSKYNVASICSVNVQTGAYGETSVTRMYFNPNILDVKESPYEPGKYYYLTQQSELYLSSSTTPIATNLAQSGWISEKICLSPVARVAYCITEYGYSQFGGSITKIDLTNGQKEVLPVDSIKRDVRDFFLTNDGTKVIIEHRHFDGLYGKNYSLLTMNTKDEGYSDSYVLPQKNMYEGEFRLLGFSPDDKDIYFKKDISVEGYGSAVEIYKYNRADKTFVNLTNPAFATYLGTTIKSLVSATVPNTSYGFSLVIANSPYEQVLVDMVVNTRLGDGTSSTTNVANNYVVTLKKTGAQYSVIMQDAFEYNNYSQFAWGHSYVDMTIKTTSLQVLATYSTNVNFDPTFVADRNYTQTETIKKVRIICDNDGLKEIMKKEVIEQIVREALDK